jgi:hypothetical protein
MDNKGQQTRFPGQILETAGRFSDDTYFAARKICGRHFSRVKTARTARV